MKIYFFFPRKKINSQSITNGLLPKISFFLCWTKLNGTNKIITTRWLVACYCKWWPFILSSVTISHHQSILITCMICLSHNSIAHIIVANVTSWHASIFILSLFSNLQNIEFTLCLIFVFSGYPLACYPIWYCWKLFEFVQNACLFFYSNPGANLNQSGFSPMKLILKKATPSRQPQKTSIFFFLLCFFLIELAQ